MLFNTNTMMWSFWIRYFSLQGTINYLFVIAWHHLSYLPSLTIIHNYSKGCNNTYFHWIG